MKVEKKMLPEAGVTLDGVWVPYDFLEELVNQDRYDSQFGKVLLAPGQDVKVACEKYGLLEVETKGGVHRGEKLAEFINTLDWDGYYEDKQPADRRHWREEYRLVRVQGDQEMVYARGNKDYVEDMFRLHGAFKTPARWEVRLVEVAERVISTEVKTDAEVAEAKRAAAENIPPELRTYEDREKLT